MKYTVKKLAELSGVSIRTLRFYDQIGLLKPAFYGENRYRYYDEEQLLLLQQILFYRELGFPLDEIQQIISSDDFNKMDALQSHRKILEQGLDRTTQLIQTIDKTIEHLRGKVKMTDKELYYGFDSEKQKEHEQHLVKEGIVTQEFLDESNEKIKNWTDQEKNNFLKDIDRIMNELIAAIEQNKSPGDEQVQQLMEQHYEWLERSWSPTKEKYLGLATLYQTPEFKPFYDTRHPKLLGFIVKAMQVFALRSL